ncbi:MAG: hypothetical protein GF355_10635, partial [Candidatus Eisenbacteria bacterium]|nr:hypothetical protein [Candidatus Eisenbacteria bacterium]
GYTSAVPNSVWGYGKIDALGAVSYGTPVSIYAFDARALDWGVELIWSCNLDVGTTGFEILRAVDDGSNASALLEHARVIATAPAQPAAAVEDRSLEASGRYAYWIRPMYVDGSGEASGPVFVDWNGAAQAPVTFHPPSPNPFRPSTAFRIDLAQSAMVSLEIIDPSGRLVRTIETEPLAPGEHVVSWDGRNGAGTAMAPGLYFAHLSAAGRETLERIVLIR